MSDVTHPEMARIARLHGLRVRSRGPEPGDASAPAGVSGGGALAAREGGGRGAPLRRSRGSRMRRPVLWRARALAGGGLRPGFRGARRSRPRGGRCIPIPLRDAQDGNRFGGAVLRVRDGTVLARMRTMEAAYPTQARREHAGRLLKGLFLVTFSQPRVYGGLVRTAARLEVNLDGVLQSLTKTHPAGASVGNSCAVSGAGHLRLCSPSFAAAWNASIRINWPPGPRLTNACRTRSGLASSGPAPAVTGGRTGSSPFLFANRRA
jgi:hypothetical protein